MKQRYVVCYDITDPKRLRRVYKKMRGFGDPVQYSVFVCDLSAMQLIRLEEALRAIVKHDEDSVLIVDVGPTEGRGRTCFRGLGQAFKPREPQAVVV